MLLTKQGGSTDPATLAAGVTSEEISVNGAAGSSSPFHGSSPEVIERIAQIPADSDASDTIGREIKIQHARPSVTRSL